MNMGMMSSLPNYSMCMNKNNNLNMPVLLPVYLMMIVKLKIYMKK